MYRPKTYKDTLHFNKPASKKGLPWTVHYRGACYIVAEIQCRVPTVSEWKPDKKSNPRAFFTAQVANITITPENVAILT